MFEMGVPIPIQTFCLLERIASFTLKEKAWQTKAFLRGRTSVTDNWSQFNLWALELYPNNNTQKRSSPLPWDISQIANESPSFQWKSRWWFQIFFIFTPTCGRFPFWLIFFKGVETTNQKWCLSNHPFSPFFCQEFPAPERSYLSYLQLSKERNPREKSSDRHFFPARHSPQKKIMYIPPQCNLYIPISPIAPSTSSTIHPKPFFLWWEWNRVIFVEGKATLKSWPWIFLLGR